MHNELNAKTILQKDVNSHIVDVLLVWCMLLKLKQQKDIRMRV